MQLLTYLHDPDDLYIPLIKNTEFPKIFKNKWIIAISPSTSEKTKKLVSKLKFIEIDGGNYGTARLNLIRYAIRNTKEKNFFLCDFDKLTHWLNTDPIEFSKIYNSNFKNDLTVIARSARALITYPETWLNTENIATKILAKIVRQKLDFMNGPLILSKKAAEIIAKQGIENGLGSCAEFCLLPHRAGLKIGSVEVDGLTWEDPDRYLKLIKKSKSYEDWKYDTFDSLYEWRKRVSFLDKQVETMMRLSEEPTNPKYPLVHNKTLEK